VKKNDVLNPSSGLLCKLGSIIVHADEMTEDGAHSFDEATFRLLLNDAEVKAWIKGMGPMLPLKRSARK
jgi:hypothetical protein